MMLRALATVLALALCAPALAVERSAAQKRAFTHANPCPSTGKPRPSCPGYVIDHVVPLCAGGADRPANMQWQTLAESRKKDIQERRQCAALRKARR